MWRDYLGWVGTILAVANGFIAITVALLPMRRSVQKLRLGALALVLAGVTVGAAFYSKVRTYAQTERIQTDRAEIRVRLASFMNEGRELLGQIRDARHEMPSARADQWAQRVEVYLRDRVGERYIQRFRTEVPELYGDDPAVAPDRLLYWRAVRNRVVALEAINAEFLEQPWQGRAK
jgi:hypothetical protein